MSSLSRRQAETEALRWLQKQHSAQWTPADEADLDSWLDVSADHPVSYVRLRSLWRRVEDLKHYGKGLPPGQVPRRREETRTATSKLSAVARVALAASIVLAVTLGIFVYLPADRVYTTPVGGLVVVPLGDRSDITVNTNTQIRIRAGGFARRIDLIYGEALFDIAPNARRPTIVYTPNQRIVVLGTKFSVWSKPSGLHMAVLSGQIRVEHSRPNAPDSHSKTADINPLQVVTINAGEAADVADGSITLRRESVAEIERSWAWQSGMIQLFHATLPQAIAEFNRYNTRQMAIGDPSLEQITIGGSFQSNNVEGFLRLLEQWGVHSEVHNGEIVLTSKH
jgi:transmembrane sensor